MLRGHAVAHRHTGVLPARLLLLLQVLVVGHLLLLFVGHVARVNACGTRHVGLLGADVVVSHILGRLGGHLRGIDTVFIGGGIGSIETGLRIESQSSSCSSPDRLRASSGGETKGIDSPG